MPDSRKWAGHAECRHYVAGDSPMETSLDPNAKFMLDLRVVVLRLFSCRLLKALFGITIRTVGVVCRLLSVDGAKKAGFR